MTLSLHQVKLHALQQEKRPLFETLVFPKTYDLFDAPDKERVIALAAFQNHHPIGLISAFAYPQVQEAFLASFFVLPEHQNQGIGTQLMHALLALLKEHGIGLIYLNYPAPHPRLESLLETTGWHPPLLLTRRYFLDQYSFHPDWYFSPYPLLPDEFTVFRWAEAEPHELALARQWEESNPAIYPMQDPKYPQDLLTSLGLRQKGQLAGWIINHRLEPKLLRYSSFYLVPEIRGLGPGIYLLKESIRRHLNNEIDVVGIMEINFKLSSRAWIRFIERRLAPYAARAEDFNYTYIIFD